MQVKPLKFLPVILFVILAFFLWRGLSLDPKNLPSSKVSQNLPKFKLPILGREQEFLTNKAFQAKFSLINIWASWCAACVDEQVFMLQLAEQGVKIYGINYKDNTESALAWLKEWGNPYQLIGEDKSGDLAIDLGVYGTPETFLIDSKGIIRHRHVGILDEASWKDEFLPKIRQLGLTS